MSWFRKEVIVKEYLTPPDPDARRIAAEAEADKALQGFNRAAANLEAAAMELAAASEEAHQRSLVEAEEAARSGEASAQASRRAAKIREILA